MIVKRYTLLVDFDFISNNSSLLYAHRMEYKEYETKYSFIKFWFQLVNQTKRKECKIFVDAFFSLVFVLFFRLKCDAFKFHWKSAFPFQAKFKKYNLNPKSWSKVSFCFAIPYSSIFSGWFVFFFRWTFDKFFLYWKFSVLTNSTRQLQTLYNFHCNKK